MHLFPTPKPLGRTAIPEEAAAEEVRTAPGTNSKTKIRMNLAERSDSALLRFTQQHIAAMTNSPHFPAPIPTAKKLLLLYHHFEVASDSAEQAAKAAKEKMVFKDMARVALEQALVQRGHYVEHKADGNEAKIVESFSGGAAHAES